MYATTPRFFASIGRFATGLRAMRAQVRTERLINELPVSIRKDIGCPDSYADRQGRRHS